MQDNNQPNVKKILLAVADYLNVKGIRGLAEALGEKESRLYAWIRNGNIVDTGAFLAKCPNINVHWLKTGEGDMLKSKENKHALYKDEENKNFTVNEPSAIDSPPRVVRDTAIDMLEWLADNRPEDFYEMLTLIRAACNRWQSG